MEKKERKSREFKNTWWYGIRPGKFKDINTISTSNKFKDNVVIVTGASSGIGKACAIEFARNGASVVLAARRKKELEEVREHIRLLGGDALSVVTDVRKIKDCENLVKKTVNTYGKINILINNAGISMRANFEDLDIEVIRELMDTNFYGAVYCTKFALPYLLKEKGTVIGISSITGLAPLPGRTGYSASKHAMDGFFNSLRLENRRKGLNVLIVHPGFTSSEIRMHALDNQGNPQAESPRDEVRMMSSEKVAMHIVHATKRRNRDLILTPQGKMVVWLHRTIPGVADRIILREMSKEKDSPF